MKSAEKLLLFSFLCEAVLCGDFSVSLPESVEAVRGLCVLIPCSFEINEGYDAELRGDPTGIWLKDGTDRNNNTVFNSKVNRENKIKGELIGDLLMKNCTTVFYNIRRNHSGEYYFRLEASEQLKYTYTSPSVCVRVGDSPIPPSITLEKEDQGEVEDQNAVVEGTSVSLVCSAPAPPCLLKPPTFSWNFLPEEGRQEQNHNTSFSSSQLTFNATHLHHGLDFTCTATYPLRNKNKSAHSSLTLHVLYGPRNTSVSASPSASVLLGSSVSLHCSSDGNPAVLNYTWYRENGEQIGTGNRLTINTTDSTHRGLYYCRAQNQHGDHNSSVYLDVQYAPQVSPSSSCNTTKDLIMCYCEVHGSPPPKLEWHVTSQTAQHSEATPIQVKSVGNTSLRKFLLFSIHQSHKGTPTLHCVGSNNLGMASQTFFFTSNTQYPAEGLNISSVLIGAAVGVSVMMMAMCGVFLCVRTINPSVSPSGQEDTPGLVLNNMPILQEEDEESVYANKAVLSESLHYSTIKFPKREGSEIRGLSSLTAKYATIHHGAGPQSKGETGEAAIEEVQEENVMNMDSVMMQNSVEEEVTYGNIKHKPAVTQTQVNLDEGDDGSKKSKETNEAKERASEQFGHSDGAEGIYAKVKPRKHEHE